MNETKKNEVLQWHPAFFAGIQIEFEEEKENLIFENEHQLSKKPLEIDVLIIKKDKDIPIHKNIGKIFRKHNIVEYKSPDDYLSIDDFYKALGYAYLYKADTNSVDEIKIEDVALTFVCHKYPRKLMKHLKECRDDEIEQYENGIYQVKGEKIPLQIILTSRLSVDENLWLRCLGNPVEDIETTNKLARIYKRKRKSNLYEAVMDMIIQTNRNGLKEGTGMCRALIELAEETMGKTLEELLEEKMKEQLEERLEEKMKEQLEERLEEKMIEAGEKVRVETILDFLEDAGKVPEELRMRIMAERDLTILKSWIKLAAKSDTVEEFQMAM